MGCVSLVTYSDTYSLQAKITLQKDSGSGPQDIFFFTGTSFIVVLVFLML
jgi:hypothetical protein